MLIFIGCLLSMGTYYPDSTVALFPGSTPQLLTRCEKSWGVEPGNEVTSTHVCSLLSCEYYGEATVKLALHFYTLVDLVDLVD